MITASEQAEVTRLETPALVFNNGAVTSREDVTSSSVELIRAEWVSLSLQQAQVQERIQHIRHALLELVHVFGPEILLTSGRGPAISSKSLSRGRVKMIDLVRSSFGESREWFTLYELMAMIRKQSETALARFINPGVAVSNALRFLERRGEVEVVQHKEGPKWRFVKGDKCCANWNTAAE